MTTKERNELAELLEEAIQYISDNLDLNGQVILTGKLDEAASRLRAPRQIKAVWVEDNNEWTWGLYRVKYAQYPNNHRVEVITNNAGIVFPDLSLFFNSPMAAKQACEAHALRLLATLEGDEA